MKNFHILCLLLTAGWAIPHQVQAQAQGHNPDLPASAAQQVVEEIGLDRFNITVSGLRPIDARNLSVLRQTGQSNQATIQQVSEGNGPNQALVVQAGNANITDFYQYGGHNEANLKLQGDSNTGSVYQNGSKNTYDGRVMGDNNKVNVVQDGDDNHAVLDVTDSYGRSYPVRQVGNKNELTQREAAGTTAPLGYGVEMRGNGIRLTIEQGRVQP